MGVLARFCALVFCVFVFLVFVFLCFGFGRFSVFLVLEVTLYDCTAAVAV